MTALLILLASAPQAHAERPLTYREALEAAVRANPTLLKSETSVVQREASVLSSLGIFDPTYSLNGSWRQSSRLDFFQGTRIPRDTKTWSLSNDVDGTVGTGTSYNFSASLNRTREETSGPLADAFGAIQDTYRSDLSVSITQQLLRGVVYRYNLRNVTQARQGLAVAELSLESTRQTTLKEAADAYWNWVYQARLRDIARDSVAVAEEALRVGRLKVEAGELAPVERTRLEAALVQAQASLLDAETTVEQSANTLLLVMGQPPDQNIVAATEAGNVPDVDLDAASAIEVALAQNLELAVARANLDTAVIDHRNARHGRLPSLSATASTGVGATSESTASDAIGGLADADNQPFVQVSGNFSVPILNRSSRGDAQRTAAARLEREIELEELERSVAAQVEQQVRTLASAQRRVELADVNLRLAEETLRAEEALSEAGRSIMKDVLEARTEVDRTRAEAAKARTDYRQAQVELLRLQGQLTEDLR